MERMECRQIGFMSVLEEESTAPASPHDVLVFWIGSDAHWVFDLEPGRSFPCQLSQNFERKPMDKALCGNSHPFERPRTVQANRPSEYRMLSIRSNTSQVTECYRPPISVLSFAAHFWVGSTRLEAGLSVSFPAWFSCESSNSLDCPSVLEGLGGGVSSPLLLESSEPSDFSDSLDEALFFDVEFVESPADSSCFS